VIKYGAFESHPCVYDDGEGWVLFLREDGWRKIHIAEIQQIARPMTEAEFKKYGDLPPLPMEAFR
jgi:hypothetical protein